MPPLVTDPARIHALLDETILTRVEKPGRYIGGETNAVCKDPAGVDVSIALAFPDVYDVGMSHQGLPILYSILNGIEWAAAERTYTPWPDMQAKMREHGIPLFALESRRPVRAFDALGFSLQYEMLYTNVLAMLDLAGIPLLAAERGPDEPIVIAGGPGAAEAEPMADFIDLFFLGDGEESIVRFAEFLREAKRAGMPRRERIIEAARRIPSLYAPAFYRADYNADGTLASLRPTEPGLPERICAASVADLGATHVPTAPIVPLVEVIHDRIVLEIQRGCTRGCRFCQAGMTRRPVRTRPAEQLVDLARSIYRHTGHDEVSLASLSSSDYPDFHDLLRRMNEFAQPLGVGLAVSSLRVDDQLHLLPEQLAQVRKSGLTVAPEAGTDRLRRVINKDVTNADLLNGVRAALHEGWKHVKLYFMVGLPTETPDDVAAIVDLCEQVSALGREAGGHNAQVNASVAMFVPKPHTPFQWEPMAGLDYLREARAAILKRARQKAVRYSFHDALTSRLECVLARGDRRVGRAIRRACEDGAQFDAWSEHFSYERWERAFAAEGLSMDFFANRARAADEVLPWDHLDFGVTKQFLRAEWEKSRREELTPDCRTGPCPVCGACAVRSS